MKVMKMMRRASKMLLTYRKIKINPNDRLGIKGKNKNNLKKLIKKNNSNTHMNFEITDTTNVGQFLMFFNI